MAERSSVGAIWASSGSQDQAKNAIVITNNDPGIFDRVFMCLSVDKNLKTKLKACFAKLLLFVLSPDTTYVLS